MFLVFALLFPFTVEVVARKRRYPKDRSTAKKKKKTTQNRRQGIKVKHVRVSLKVKARRWPRDASRAQNWLSRGTLTHFLVLEWRVKSRRSSGVAYRDRRRSWRKGWHSWHRRSSSRRGRSWSRWEPESRLEAVDRDHEVRQCALTLSVLRSGHVSRPPTRLDL